jgi:hypothetical protein
MSPHSLPSLRTSRKVFVLLLIDGILLFPTGGILLLMLTMPYIPMSFWGRTTIANETSETIYVTGVGGLRRYPSPRYPLAASWWRYPYVPRFHEGENQLKPGSSITFWYYEEKGWGMTDALLRDSQNNLYQLTGAALAGDTIVVSDLSALPAPDPAALQFTRKKTFNGEWIPIGILLAPWLTFVPLLLLYRRQRRKHLSFTPEAMQRWERTSGNETFRSADGDIRQDSSRASPP